ISRSLRSCRSREPTKFRFVSSGVRGLWEARAPWVLRTPREPGDGASAMLNLSSLRRRCVAGRSPGRSLLDIAPAAGAAYTTDRPRLGWRRLSLTTLTSRSPLTQRLELSEDILITSISATATMKRLLATWCTDLPAANRSPKEI